MRYRVAITLPDGSERESETHEDFTKAIWAAAEQHKATGLDVRLAENIEEGRNDELIIISEDFT